MNDASSALGRVAADMSAGQPEIFAQELHQQGACFDVTSDGFAVHRHGHGRHDFLPIWGQKPSFRRRPLGRRRFSRKIRPISAQFHIGT
jgi:hypothetical protein